MNENKNKKLYTINEYAKTENAEYLLENENNNIQQNKEKNCYHSFISFCKSY